MRAALVLCAALALAGCVGHPLAMPFAQSADALQEPVAKPVIKSVVKQRCSPWHKWSDEDLKALAAALAPVPDNSIIIRMAIDWRRYYGDAKACGDAQH